MSDLELSNLKEMNKVLRNDNQSLMYSLEALKQRNDSLERSKFRVDKIINVENNQILQIENIHQTEAGIIIEIKG